MKLGSLIRDKASGLMKNSSKSDANGGNEIAKIDHSERKVKVSHVDHSESRKKEAIVGVDFSAPPQSHRSSSSSGAHLSSSGTRKKHVKRKGARHAIQASVAAFDAPYQIKVFPKPEEARRLIHDALMPNLLFRACSSEELYELVDVFRPKRCPKHVDIIREGSEGDGFYVMEKGQVDVFEKDAYKCSLQRGHGFGEIALLYSCPRTATVRAKEECELWMLDRQAFREITARHKRNRLNMKMSLLAKVKIDGRTIGQIMKRSEMHSMALASKFESYPKGTTIVRQGESGDAFYMIETGEVDVYIKEKGNKPLVTLKSGDFFGEKALLSSAVRTATCVAHTNVKCMLLMREDFVDMLGNMADLIERSYKDHELDESFRDDGHEHSGDHPRGEKFNKSDFDIKRTLGVGAYGYVKLVQWKHAAKGSDQYYALKCISREKIEEKRQQKKIKREEDIMKALVHPFIARCFNVMEDQKGKYFLMEALCGGELCEMLYFESTFPEDWTMFYAASVLTALAHMHERKIAYRDLKTENLVLDEAGFVKVVDFGLAKKITSGQTYTFCGTPDYLAPEVILNEGYDWGVDYWGLGVLIYEMGAGVAPFYAENPMDTYRKALSGQVPMPEKFSRALVSIIKKLLHTSQTKRLGRTAGGATTVMCHRWFSNFDWDGLMECRLKPPIKPEIKSPEEESGSSHDVEGFAIDFL